MNPIRKAIVIFFQLVVISAALAQDGNLADDKSNKKSTRQGFGDARGLQMPLGFVNGELRTEGTAYYFADWNTQGTILTKDKGNVKISGVNINLFSNKLEALFDENKVFTFDSENLIRIVINGKLFRLFDIDGELKMFELFYNEKLKVYRNIDVSYTKGSVNPMIARNSNKYIKKEKYYLYKNGELTLMKLTKKSIAKLLESDTTDQNAILAYIKQNRLSVKEETDFIKILEFANK